MAISPTQNSLKWLAENGYAAEVVEQYKPVRGNWAMGKRHDLFGFGDIFAIHEESGEILIVQTTAYSGVSARVKKINSDDLAKNVALVRKAGIRIVVHGWRKVKGRWTFREVDLS